MTARKIPSRAVQLHRFAEDLVSNRPGDATSKDFTHLEASEAADWLLAAVPGRKYDDACSAVAYAADTADGKARERLNRLFVSLLDPDLSLDRMVEIRDALRAGMIDSVRVDIREELPDAIDALHHEASLRRGAPDPARDPMALAKEVH